jgi:hypothetical protein
MTLFKPSLAATGVLFAVLAAPLVQAKLPSPSAEAQIKADQAKAKAAWTSKEDSYKLCLKQNEVVEGYRKSAQAAGRETHPALPTPPCTDPGPYAAAEAASSAKPLEASGAHSPAETATSPPGSNATQSEIQGENKK